MKVRNSICDSPQLATCVIQDLFAIFLPPYARLMVCELLWMLLSPFTQKQQNPRPCIMGLGLAKVLRIQAQVFTATTFAH